MIGIAIYHHQTRLLEAAEEELEWLWDELACVDNLKILRAQASRFQSSQWWAMEGHIHDDGRKNRRAMQVEMAIHE